MAITPAELLTRVNNETGRSETDLTPYLRDTIHDLERDGLFLEAESSVALTSGTRNYNVPTDYNRPLHIWPLDSSGITREPLDEISYEEFKRRLIWNSGNSRPTEFAIWNGVIYLDPPPNATTYPNMRIVAFKNHSDTVTTIEYPEKYRAMLANGCAYYIEKRYGNAQTPRAQTFMQEFTKEKRGFIGVKNRERPLRIHFQDV